LVAFDADTVVPPWTVRALSERVKGVVRYVKLSAPSGHDGYRDEVEAVGKILGEALKGG
jgi:homoserine acetyltransferase